MSTPAELPVPQADLHGPTSYKIGKKVKATFLVATRYGEPVREKEYWLAISDNESLFGLVFSEHDTMISHMSYGMSYFVAQESIEWMETRGEGFFTFDAGTTCPWIRCSQAEMERAFRELGML